MLEGLKETQAALADRRIAMVVRRGHPAEVALLAGDDAALLVCDRGYMRHQKAWRRHVAARARCRVAQVESDVVVPVEVVSDKAEYAARTIRPKIHTHLSRFLIDLKPTPVTHSSVEMKRQGLDLHDLDAVLDELTIDRSVAPVSEFFRGGTAEAKKRFHAFIHARLDGYHNSRNQPQTDDTSHMSMYLHFGQISPLYLALRVQRAHDHGRKDKDTFLEQLIVRRELAMNFVHFTRNYDSFACLPKWAQGTLLEHKKDRRAHIYTRRELERAETHDDYWNAAQREMMHTGYMHNYMRMYWSKKILEWSRSPARASTSHWLS